MQIGTHSFTFDHVYGSNASPSTAMFDDCVAPLVDGLFQGYNATVLAYGQVKLIEYLQINSENAAIKMICIWEIWVSNVVQTGSGKTYTMGTSLKDGCHTGIIPKVMNALFSKIETLKHEIEFQLHVSFIEVHATIISLAFSRIHLGNWLINVFWIHFLYSGIQNGFSGSLYHQ